IAFSQSIEIFVESWNFSRSARSCSLYDGRIHHEHRPAAKFSGIEIRRCDALHDLRRFCRLLPGGAAVRPAALRRVAIQVTASRVLTMGKPFIAVGRDRISE